MEQQVTLTRQAIRTPRAAAVAGISFLLLFTTSMVLIRLAIAEEVSGTNAEGVIGAREPSSFLGIFLYPRRQKSCIIVAIYSICTHAQNPK
jgi:hypothetical protein